MGIGDEELGTSKELQLRVDARGIYREAIESYRIWKNSDTKESLGHLGVDGSANIKGGIFSSAYFSIGTGFIYDGNRDRTPEMEFRTNLYFSDNVKRQENKGYVDDSSVNKLRKSLEDQGFENVGYTNGEYNRYFQMELGGKVYRLVLGYKDLDSNIKGWERYKIGDQPDYNSGFSLSMQTERGVDQGKDDLPITESEFESSSNSLLEATKRVIWASDEFFSVGKSSADVFFESQKTKGERQRSKLGFSITDYSEGEFDPDGDLSESVYSEVDNLKWKEKQDRIVEWRGLGNRQILTMHKDRLVFGRWAGRQASEDGTQADVLIDEDIDTETQKIIQELGVSRRHFAISYNEQVSNALKDSTHGIVEDSLILEDLYPTNKTVVIRRDEASEILFGGMEFVEKGSKTIILPGDLIMVGGGSQPARSKEEWVNHQSRGIGLIYLGERRFVKVVVGEKDSDLVADLLALTDKAALNRYLDEKGIAQNKVDMVLDGDSFNDPVMLQALRVIEKSEAKLQAREGYSQEQIKEMDTNDLLDLIGNSEVGQEQTLEHALFAVTLRNEPDIVGYALATALRIGGFDETVELLSKADVWKKIPGTYVLQALDYIENADISDEQKAKFCSIAYTSRDDSVKLLIRKRIERYVDKGITSFF